MYASIVLYCASQWKSLSVAATVPTMKRLVTILVWIIFTTQEIPAEIKIPAVSPTIISRKEWGAPPPKTKAEPLKNDPAPFVVIHHSATRGCWLRPQCEALVSAFQNHHVYTNGWNDIGYNFLIGEDGNIYEGRGWGVTGKHSTNYDNRSLGICFIGNFENRAPDSVATEAAKKLLEYALASGKLTSDYILLGHQQLIAATCPGAAFYESIRKWPHWEPYVDIQQ